jgi:hypothetical protein
LRITRPPMYTTFTVPSRPVRPPASFLFAVWSTALAHGQLPS